MTDRLERALRATRERETGESPDADATLRRILASRRAAKLVWVRRARVWIPIAAVLAFTTAALARWGSLGSVRALLTGAAPTPAVVAPMPASAPAPATEPGIAPEPTPEPEAAPTPTPTATATVTATVATEPAPGAARSSPRTHALPVAVASSLPPVTGSDTAQPAPPAAASPAAAAPSDDDADAYGRAHRLHFDSSDPAAALAAWDDYLARFPAGRFAPDARYNRAIDLIKLRRYGEARIGLQPFADGALGGYHRDDARALLRSIP
jgi:TolA-binding protein